MAIIQFTDIALKFSYIAGTTFRRRITAIHKPVDMNRNAGFIHDLRKRDHVVLMRVNTARG